MQLQSLLLASLALGPALAQPAHRHARHHKFSLRNVLGQRDVPAPAGGWNNPDLYPCINFTQVYLEGHSDDMCADKSTSGSSPAPVAENKVAVNKQSSSPSSSSAVPVSVASSSVAPSSTPSSGGGTTGGSTGNSGLSCVNVANKLKRATYEQDTYVGNTGSPGAACSNMKAESSCSSSGSYSITFTNNMGHEAEFWLWNKIGADQQTMNGMMTTPCFTFQLDNGKSTVFTVQPNSQVAFSYGGAGRASTNGGVPNCNVGEANFDAQDKGTSGSFYDVSMVTYNDIKNTPGGSPQEVPMTITAPNYDASTNSNCVYTSSSQNSPVQPGSSGKCAMGPIDSSPFHITATFG
ncbi:MAG: hypothetical protein OHK93_007606 [Ramalina farinacea]|uniref:Allergen Asp f 4 n=1 Tax=Ramalina farinacea TaxID=258253 RepID=A0AA43QM03_9LECA|nr:hypothetical protein [Ramalina farinacea]